METLRQGSTGPNVKLIQSFLAKIGYYTGPVDGKFGPMTREAVIQFQKKYGLVPDGVVGTATWRLFDIFLKGYDTYRIKSGDTLYSIARNYYTSVDAILTANAGINPRSLKIGQDIIVPYDTP